MKARMPAGFGRPDMNALMRQAQKMQEDMKAKQAELEAAEYTGSASGEMVTVRMNGKHEILGGDALLKPPVDAHKHGGRQAVNQRLRREDMFDFRRADAERQGPQLSLIHI